MESEFAKWVIGQAGISGVAAMALYMVDRTYKMALAREKEYAELNREDKLKLWAVLQENTAALSRLTTLIDNFMRSNGHEK